MAIESTTKLSEKIEKVDKIYNEVNKGQSAEAVLRILDPLADARLGQLLSQFEQCPPDLGGLLDLRARISELWRIRRSLNDAKKLGLSAQKMIEGLMEMKNNNPSGNRT